MKHLRVPRITHKRVQQAVSLFALVGFTLFVASPVTTLAAEEIITNTNNDTTVTTQETYSALKKTNGVLDTSKQTKTTSDDAESLKTASAGATITIPKDAKKGVTLEQTGVSVSLPNANKAKKGKTVANGTVAYEGTNGSANAVQANADGSVRMLTVIDNPNAPTKYDYQLTLPQGARIQLNQDGSATILKTTAPNIDEAIATIDKPWAKDANGKTIQTNYTVNGSTLTQHIKHKVKGVRYPVAADPRVSFGWYVYVKLSPADQRFLLQAYPSVFAGFVCAVAFKNVYAVAACATAGGLVKDWIGSYYNPNRWVEVRFTYQGNFAGIKRL